MCDSTDPSAGKEEYSVSYARNADLSFLTHLDGSGCTDNIIRFAMDPKDTELFMQIYYRLKLFFNKKDALRYAQISQEKDMEVLDSALKYGNLENIQDKDKSVI